MTPVAVGILEGERKPAKSPGAFGEKEKSVHKKLAWDWDMAARLNQQKAQMFPPTFGHKEDRPRKKGFNYFDLINETPLSYGRSWTAKCENDYICTSHGRETVFRNFCHMGQWSGQFMCCNFSAGAWGWALDLQESPALIPRSSSFLSAG